MLRLARFTGSIGALVVAFAIGASAQREVTPSANGRYPVTVAYFVATPATGQAPLDVHFEDRSLGHPSSWTWDFGDGTTSHLQNPTHRYTEGGFYSVTLTASGRRGTHTLVKPQGVIVTSCTVRSARANRVVPLDQGEDFVPVTGDDSLGFYCVYSGKAVAPNSPGIANNVGLFIFPLSNGEVLLFGSGYGDANAFVPPTHDAAYDVRRVDSIIRFCLGRVPEKTPIRFVAPHGHIDHINSDCMRELRARGYPIAEITFHAADSAWIKSLPGWTPADRALFRTLRGTTGLCREELLSFASPLGKLWFYLRSGHTPGSIDLVIDVRNDPTNRFIVRGSGESFGSCPIPGTRDAIDPHGNAVLSAPPPRFFSLSPNTGSAIGGTVVALFGQALAAAEAGVPSVLFDGAPASAVTVLDDGTLTCSAPPGLPGRTSRVQIINRNGSAALENIFAFRPLPTLTGITPDHGLASGGTRVTLKGSGFLANEPGANTVTFGGVGATALQVLDDATLQCTTPAGSAGNVEVVLGNLNGFAELTSFRFDALIDVASLTPVTGSARGGTRVTIQGSAFAVSLQPPEVFFGKARATGVVRVSDTTLTCLTPPGPAGALVDVSVSGENGGDLLVNGFRYFFAPKPLILSPASGPQSGNTSVTITGVNFTRNSAGTNSVTFGGVPALGVVTLTDTSLRCLTPPGLGGSSVDVEISNANGAGALAQGFRYHRPPTLTALDPVQGDSTGNTLLTLHGAGFLETGAGTGSVRVGGVPATALNVLDDSTLACRTPPGVSGARVDVDFDNANGHARLPQAFRYVTRPTLAALDPSNGSSRGGTTITIQGSGFLAPGAGTPVLAFAGAVATGVHVLGDGSLTCSTPEGRPGTTVDLVLTNANGQALLAGAFHYLELPRLTEVVPREGALSGGTPVELRGAGFLAGAPARVSFDGRSATDVLVRDDQHLTCTTPTGAPGVANVILTTKAGSVVLLEGYLYGTARLNVARVDPDHGRSQGGVSVEVRGSGFASGQAGTNFVRFGTAAATGVLALNDTTLRCVPPGGVPGTTVEVRVTNGNGSAAAPAPYRYHRQPSLATVVPSEGTMLGGVLVTLGGSGFEIDGAAPNEVRFGGQPASEVQVLGDGTLTCRLPPASAPGQVDVELSNANGAAELALAFRYRTGPSLTSLAPLAGTALGGAVVTLTGSGFASSAAGAPRVFFDSRAAASVVVVNDTTLTCLTPAGTAGAVVEVRVENADGVARLAAAFSYHAAPLISSLAPGNGLATGGTTVTLNGSGFRTQVVGANAVTFGGIPARSVTTVDDTRVRAVSPAGQPGQRVDLALSNSNGSAVVPLGFRYNAAPAVASLLPAGGTALGGVTVTLTGSGFQRDGAGTNSVFFGANAATAVTVVDDQTLHCLTPSGASGSAVPVSVTNNNGTTAAPPSFAYFAAPTVVEVVPAFGFSGGATSVELHGSGFLQNAPGPNQVLFGGQAATQLSVVNDTTLRALTPPGSVGPVAVQVSNGNGSATLADGFFFDWAPTLTGLLPVVGSSLGGTEVHLTGGGFATLGSGPLSVRFGAGQATNVRVLDGQNLLCTTPAGPANTSVSVLVTNTRGSSSLDGFRYHPRPTLTSVDPAQGPPEGGTLVTLRGSGFVANAAGSPQVLFGGSPATGLTLVDDGTLRCLSPAGPARTTIALTLSNANGSASLPGAFRWLRREPSDLNGDGVGDALLGGLDSAFLFFGDTLFLADEKTTTADLVFRPAVAGSDFGAQVAFGDLNADQVSDAVVAAPLDDSSGADAGAVFVFFGPLFGSPTARLATSASAVFRGAAPGDRFGTSLTVGDVSGDGLADLVIGAPFQATVGTDAGAAYVFRGGAGFASLPTASAAVRLLGGGSQHAFGASVAAGDVTGDGVADLVVGAPIEGANGGNSGCVYVFRGGPVLASGGAAAAQTRILGAQSGDKLGSSVAVADFDGDRIDDLFLSAPEAKVSGNQSGSVFCFRGGATLATGVASAAQAILGGEVSGDRLGQALSLGDANGDGKADLLLGAPQNDVPALNAGRAYLVLGGPLSGGPIAQVADMVLMAENSSGDQFGTGASLTDLDGDGLADLLVGAPFSNGGGADSGRVYVFFGARLQAARSAGADDATYTGALPALTLGRDVGSAR